jgi:hypothetical protein
MGLSLDEIAALPVVLLAKMPLPSTVTFIRDGRPVYWTTSPTRYAALAAECRAVFAPKEYALVVSAMVADPVGVRIHFASWCGRKQHGAWPLRLKGSGYAELPEPGHSTFGDVARVLSIMLSDVTIEETEPPRD